MEQCQSWVRVDAAGEVVDAIRRSTVLIIIHFRASALVGQAQEATRKKSGFYGLNGIKIRMEETRFLQRRLFPVDDRPDRFTLHGAFQTLRLP
jgi:hypothetical protein